MMDVSITQEWFQDLVLQHLAWRGTWAFAGKDVEPKQMDIRDRGIMNVTFPSAPLGWSSFQHVKFVCCNFRGATFAGAKMEDVEFVDCDLTRVRFDAVDLESVRFAGCALNDAHLECATNVPDMPETLIVPQKGEFVGWKRAGDVIVKLLIPADAKRSNATGRKCRCSYAEVLDLQGPDGVSLIPYGITSTRTNEHGPETWYTVGKPVYPNGFDPNRWHECAPGIHFFITREEAVRYGRF